MYYVNLINKEKVVKMEIQKVPFYAKLLPIAFADKNDEQFAIAPDWSSGGSTELMCFNKSNFFILL